MIRQWHRQSTAVESMFKKENDVAQRSNSLMKNKEIRKLKSDIQSALPRLTEDDTTALIPNKGNVSLTKLANRSILYSVDDIPLFIDILGRSSFIPTIFTLWRVPSALRCIVVHSPVSSFILRGADLMLPGVVVNSTEMEGLERGEYVCIRVANNPMPFAVGTSEVSYEGIQVNGMKGKGVNILHMYGDELWKGSSLQPNDGFSTDCIYEINMEGADCERKSATSEECSVEEDDETDDQQQKIEGNVSKLTENADFDDTLEDTMDSTQLVGSMGVCNLEHGLSTTTMAAVTSSADVNDDRNLELILLVALKYHIKDAQLPLLASTFWGTVAKTTNLVCDIKKSRYKKVSVFLQYYQRQGLLSLTDKNGVMTVTKVDRGHQLFIGINKESAVGKVENATDVHESAGSVFGWSNVSGIPDGKMKILSLYKLSKPAKEFFGNVKGEYGEYLQAREIRECVMSSLTTNQYGGLLECEYDRGKVSILTKSSFGVFLLGKNAGSVKKNEEKSAKISTQIVGAGLESHDNFMEEYEEEDELTQQLSRGGENIAGVWMPTSIHKKDVKTANVNDFPPLGSVVGASSGGAATGEQKWRPVSLPKGESSQKHCSSSSFSGEITETEPKVKASKDKEAIEMEVTMGKDELMKRVLSKLSAYTAIIQGEEVKISSGGPPTVVLDVKKRAGNKDVTLVRGLQSFGMSNEAVSKDWQKLFACSVSVATVAGMAKEKEIMIQGNMVNELERCLHDKWNIPRELIINNKKGVGGKGKTKK